mgnify:FL=1|tara:strand:+ start:6759 stop:7499 length:741 start_codon:yes stop_codon:yes gene_type:complete
MYEKLKKKYGQNFLIDKNIIKKISNLIPKKSSNIIEIGPGDGRLTEYILNLEPNELRLIEIDADLIPILHSKFNKFKNVKIINDNMMKYEVKGKIDLIISNLPYNISSQILVKICLMRNLPLNLILMFQKEFAQRLMDKNLNSLNSLVNCFYNVNSYFIVSRNCFRPIPKIDSTVLSFTKKESPLLKLNEIDKFIEFKRNLFSYKRKTLNNLLKSYKPLVQEIDLKKRVEDLNLNQLLKIFREINF